MGTYYNSAEEIAEAINDALCNYLEEDFTLEELEKAFDIVRLKQREILLGY